MLMPPVAVASFFMPILMTLPVRQDERIVALTDEIRYNYGVLYAGKPYTLETYWEANEAFKNYLDDLRYWRCRTIPPFIAMCHPDYNGARQIYDSIIKAGSSDKYNLVRNFTLYDVTSKDSVAWLLIAEYEDQISKGMAEDLVGVLDNILKGKVVNKDSVGKIPYQFVVAFRKELELIKTVDKNWKLPKDKTPNYIYAYTNRLGKVELKKEFMENLRKRLKDAYELEEYEKKSLLDKVGTVGSGITLGVKPNVGAPTAIERADDTFDVSQFVYGDNPNVYSGFLKESLKRKPPRLYTYFLLNIMTVSYTHLTLPTKA